MDAPRSSLPSNISSLLATLSAPLQNPPPTPFSAPPYQHHQLPPTGAQSHFQPPQHPLPPPPSLGPPTPQQPQFPPLRFNANGFDAGPSHSAPPRGNYTGPSKTVEQRPGGNVNVNDGRRVYIGGIPDGATEEDLRDCFGQLGPVMSVDLKKGYGFVEYEYPSSARDAIAKYHEGHFLGAQIRVELSTSHHAPVPNHKKSFSAPDAVSQRKKRASKVKEGSEACYKCGLAGHWPRDCKKLQKNTSEEMQRPKMSRLEKRRSKKEERQNASRQRKKLKDTQRRNESYNSNDTSGYSETPDDHQPDYPPEHSTAPHPSYPPLSPGFHPPPDQHGYFPPQPPQPPPRTLPGPPQTFPAYDPYYPPPPTPGSQYGTYPPPTGEDRMRARQRSPTPPYPPVYDAASSRPPFSSRRSTSFSSDHFGTPQAPYPSDTGYSLPPTNAGPSGGPYASQPPLTGSGYRGRRGNAVWGRRPQ
ncbi:hypothetical protein BT69DRAFT_526552 [Atractiella rhizophila]|nr:hypothetical protein BT69DRAFT_526552 [Atractiella rhizophila]